MTMFKFGFEVDKDENSVFKEDEIASKGCEESEIFHYDCNEIFPIQKHLDNLDVYQLHSENFPVESSTKILYMKSGALLKTFSEVSSSGNIGKAESNHTDLIPGVYEGGAKVWECSEDLITYFDTLNTNNSLFKDKSVLDLGCGAGVLGIYSIKSNAAVVHFQDYNSEVLENITIPTVLLNLSNRTLKSITEKCKFYSGDWSKYIEVTRTTQKFDVILTSETIYNPTNYKKLLDVFDMKLNVDGIVLLGAKIYYFGVGGGLRQFENEIEKDNRFRSETVWKSEIGLSREILKIIRR